VIINFFYKYAKFQKKVTNIKTLASRNVLAFDDMYGYLVCSRCSDDFMKQKVYFSQLMRVCVGLKMLASCRVLIPGFLASYWPARYETFWKVSAFASHWLKDCANCTPTPEEND
jgi:hypothetical protein